MKRLLLLSGAMGAGKSSIAAELKAKHFFSAISTSSYLRENLNSITNQGSRLSLQKLGDQFDIQTNFTWVIDSVAIPAINNNPNVENWLLDAVRKPRQVELFREKFGCCVKHVHLFASEDELQRRFLERDHQETINSYIAASRHPNELIARSLRAISDHAFDTTEFSINDIVMHILFLWER